MTSTEFQLHKLRRFIKTQGQPLELQTQKTNDFGEPDGEPIAKMLTGVYHEIAQYYLTTSTSSASSVRKKPAAMVMCLYEDAKEIAVGQKLKLNGRTYRVTEVKDMSELNLVCDIPLEEVQGDGKGIQV